MTPRDRQYRVMLNPHGDRLEVWYRTDGSNVLAFVVKLEAHIDGVYREVVRFDSAHGRPHRDTLDWFGNTVRKRWSPVGATNNLALTDAIGDIELNWE